MDAMGVLARGRRPALLVTMCCAALAVTACGGGGGGGSTPPTNLEGTHIAPDDGGSDVALDVVPTFYSDVATIDCATVSSASFTLAMDPGPAVTGAVACGAHRATFTPDADLVTSTRYVARLTAKDTAGAFLCQNCAWRFTTRAAMPPPASGYTVGGSVAGLTGTGLNLRNNGGDDLAIAASGLFTFVTTVASGGAYDVSVRTQPTGQKCTVASGSGTVAAASITNVAVTCAARSTTPIAFVYLPHYAPSLHAISQFWMDETGELHALSPASVDPGGLALGGTAVIAADPTGSHLYVAADAGGVRHYAIGTDGTLSPQEVTTTSYPFASQVGIHPSGQWAFVASTDNTPGRNSQIDRYAIGPDGALSALPAETVAVGNALAFVVDPSGQDGYTAGTFKNPNTNTDSTRILHYPIRPDGTWALAGDVFYKPLNAGPPILDPLDRFAYFSAYQLQDRYTVEADGQLTAAGTFDLGGTFGYLSFHPSGAHAFASRTADNTIVQLTVDAGGALTSQGAIPSYGTSIGGAAVDPTGRFVYVHTVPFGSATRGLAQFTVDAQGRLLPMAVSTVITDLGGWPTTSVVIVPAR